MPTETFVINGVAAALITIATSERPTRHASSNSCSVHSLTYIPDYTTWRVSGPYRSRPANTRHSAQALRFARSPG
jgi:hypothetical protein